MFRFFPVLPTKNVIDDSVPNHAQQQTSGANRHPRVRRFNSPRRC